jgi:hypothetical protein
MSHFFKVNSPLCYSFHSEIESCRLLSKSLKGMQFAGGWHVQSISTDTTDKKFAQKENTITKLRCQEPGAKKWVHRSFFDPAAARL